MKIRKLQLKNIGVFDDEAIEFQPCPAKDKAEIHIFTGQNGSGKTTILLALAEYIKYDLKTIWQYRFLDKDKTIFDRLRTDFCIDVETDSNEEIPIEKSNNATVIGSVDTSLLALRKYYLFVFHGQSNDYTAPNEAVRKIGSEKSSFYGLLGYCAFAYSGYRQVKNKKINIFDEIEENPLYRALDFVKDENSKFTINQWLGRNLCKRALALEDNNKEAKKYTENIESLEKAIADIVGYDIRFKLKTDLSLVLIKDNLELDFDVLPDGLKSLISWIGDLLMRLDSLKWKDDTPIFEREIILFLDEIEVHLHPAWQRKVLPVVQKLLKNSQIFISTHWPFVVNSIDDAWVYKLKLEDGKAKVESVERSEDARSYRYVLRNTFDIENEFGVEIEKRLKDFYEERDSFLAGNGNSKKSKAELKKIAKELSKQSKELKSKIDFELFQLNEITGEEF